MENWFQYSRIKFRHIQCFLAVAQLRNLQRAAERLSITQPAVSKTLAELEETVGQKLFERGRHGAELTPAGRLFAPYAEACLGNLRSGIDKLVNAHEGPAISIQFGVLPTVAKVIVPPALKLFRHLWPTASVQIVSGVNSELLERLASAELQFAVGRIGEPAAMAGLSFEHLYREPLAVVVHARHPLLQVASLNAQAICEYPLLVAPQGTLIRQSTDSVLAAFGIPMQSSKMESLSVSLNLELTLHNDAVWFVPMSLVEQQIADGSLEQLSMPFGGTDEPIGMLRRSASTLHPAASALFEALRTTGLARERARILDS